MEEKNLEALRREIDDIDDAMVRLYVRRMNAVRQVAAYKQAHAVPVRDAARERCVLERAAKTAGALDAQGAKALLRLLMRQSRTAQERAL